MHWLLALETLGGILGYIGVIISVYYIHGRRYPHQYRMDEFASFLTAIWPITLVLAIPVGIVMGIGYGVSELADYIRDIGIRQGHAKFQAMRDREMAAQDIENIEMFEDNPVDESDIDADYV